MGIRRLIGLGTAFFLCLLFFEVNAQGQQTKPTPSPLPTPRRPLPKLSNGARGFEKSTKDSSIRLIAIGGGYGAGEDEEPLPKLKSKTALGYYQWGIALSNRLAMNEAIAALEKAITLNPNLIAAHWKLGNVYAEYNNLVIGDESKYDSQECYRRAIAAFEQVRLRQPRRAGVYNNLGVLYFNTAQYEKAIAAFETGLSLKPKGGKNDCSLREAGTLEDSEIYFFVGSAHEQLGNYEPALKFYQRAAFTPDEVYTGRYKERLGSLYEKLGETDKAIAAYQEIELKDGFYAEDGFDFSGEIPLRLGLLYAKKGSFAQAATHFHQAATSYQRMFADRSKRIPGPDDEEFWKAEWETMMRRIIDGLASSHYNLGVAFLMMGQGGKAVDALRRSIEANPQNPEAIFNLGFAYLSIGNKTAAREQAHALRRIDPELAAELEQMISR